MKLAHGDLKSAIANTVNMADFDSKEEETLPLTENNQLNEDSDPLNDLMSEELKQICTEHEEGILDCVSIFKKFALISIALSINITLRVNIIILYLKSMKYDVPNNNESIILGLVLLESMSQV